MQIESLVKLIEPKDLQQIQESFASKNGLGIVIVNEQGVPLTAISNYFSLSDGSEVDDKRLLDVLLPVPMDVHELGLADGRPVFASFMDGLIIRAVCPMLLQGKLIGIIVFIKLEKKNDYDQFEHWAQVLRQNPINKTTSLALLDPLPRTPSDEVLEIIDEIKTAFELLLEAGIDRENTLHASLESPLQLSKAASGHNDWQGGFIYTNRLGDIQTADSEAVSLLGFDSVKEMVGLNFLNHFILEAEDRRAVGAKLMQAGRVDSYSLTLERKDGHTFGADLTILPHEVANQSIVGFKYGIQARSLPAEASDPANDEQSDIERSRSDAHQQEGNWETNIEELLAFWGDDSAANEMKALQLEADILDDLAVKDSSAENAGVQEETFSAGAPDKDVDEAEDSWPGMADPAFPDGLKSNSSETEARSAPAIGATFLTDAEGLVQQANYAALRLLAISQEKIIGKSILSLFAGKDQELLQERIRLIADGKSLQAAPLSVFALSGGQPLSITVRRLPNKADSTFQLLWLLQAEKEDSSLVSETSPAQFRNDDMIAKAFDCHWAMIISDPELFRQGVHPDAPIGDSIVPALKNPSLESLIVNKERHAEESWKRFATACLKVFATGETRRDVLSWHYDADRPVPRCFRHVLFPLLEGGKTVGVQGLSTELTSAEMENLAAGEGGGAAQHFLPDSHSKWSEEEVLLLLNNLGKAFLTIEADGRMIPHNDICYGMLGYDRDEKALGVIPFTRLVSEEDREPVWAALQRVMKGREKSCQLTFKVNKQDKTRIELQATFWPLIKNAQVTGVQAVLQEARPTEGHSAPASRLQKLDGLGVITGGIAHDFGNLITEIFGYTSLLLLEENLHAKHREIIMHIQKVAQWSSQLTRQLLYFSTSEKPTLMPVQLNRVITQSVDLMKHFFPHNITIDLQLDAELELMMGDAMQLQQVVNNLCMNARDAMPDGGLLTLRTLNGEPGDKALAEMNAASGKNYIVLQVVDNGIGIAPEVQDRIFEPFFTTKPAGKGTGLGLASVYGIVKSHKGFIKVESKLNQGAVFTLWFPAVERVQHRESNQFSEVMGGNETVLIIDDEQDIIEVNSTMLERYGYTVFTAMCAQEGIEILKQKGEKIDLVIIDVMLPDMTGPACAEKLNSVAPHCSIILSSGYRRNAEFNKSIGRLGGTWLQKPYDSVTLLETVRKVLDKKKAGKK